MITFYYSLAPNPMKVALCLEEMGLAYDPRPVDTRKGEQHQPDFLKVNPNAKVPAIHDEETGALVFDSNAILLHLAEKTGRFLGGGSPASRGELLSWLMFIATGVGPYAGQCVHFRHFAPEPMEYGVTRYEFEARRHFRILDERLGRQPFLLGEDYTIVDMALWGWARMVPFVLGAGLTDQSVWPEFPNLKRHLDQVSARPAAAAVMALRDRHAFKQEFDEEARRHMFRHLAQPAA